MSLVQTTKPTSLVVSLADAKEQCRVADVDTHDVLLTRLIISATAAVEAVSNVRLPQRSMRLDLNTFPSGKDIELPVYPVQSITSVVYDDADDAEQTLVSGTDYWAVVDGYTPFIRSNGGWPSTYSNKPGAVRITMVVGYSDTANVPEDLRHAILIRVKELFDHGGESITGVSVEHAMNTVETLVAPHRRYFK